MTKKIALWTILALMLLGSCKSLTQEGRSLNQARRALRDQNYTQSIDLAIQAINIDPEFYDAMSFLSGAFREGNEYYQGIIDRMEPMADSIDQVEGDVILPVDKIYQSFIAMDRMSRSVENAGYERMVDADKDQTYLCEIDYFEIELGEWRPRAMETHYQAITTFLGREHPMEAKQAHKHAVYLRSQYDSDYMDSETLEAEALDAAQITLAVVVRKNSREDKGITPSTLIQKVTGELQKNAEIMTYARVVQSDSLEDMTWGAAEASTEEMGLWATESGIDYLLVLDMNTQNSSYSINSSGKQSILRDSINSLDGSGNPMVVESTIIVNGNQVLMKAGVHGYGRLLEAATGSYYFSVAQQGAAAEEKLSYTLVSPGNVNSIQRPLPPGGSNTLGMEALMDFKNGRKNGFIFLLVESDLPYYQHDETTGTVTTVPVSTIYGDYLGVNQMNYFAYYEEALKYFSENNSKEKVLPDLWIEVTEKCYQGLVDILD